MIYLPDSESGQGLVEFALVLILVVIVVVAILALLGPQLSSWLSQLGKR